MRQSGILSDYPKAPNGLLIRVEGCGFFTLVTSRQEGILHCAFCCTLIRFGPLCRVKKWCNNNMPKIKTFIGIKLPFSIWRGNKQSIVGFFFNKMSQSYYTGRGNVCCLFTRQKQTEDTPIYPASLVTSLEFNITCHIVKHEIISEAERPKKPLWTALLVRFQLMLEVESRHLYKL